MRTRSLARGRLISTWNRRERVRRPSGSVGSTTMRPPPPVPSTALGRVSTAAGVSRSMAVVWTVAGEPARRSSTRRVRSRTRAMSAWLTTALTSDGAAERT